MNRLLKTRRVSQLLFGLMIVALGFSSLTETAKAQCDVIVPNLNLTGSGSGYDEAWYPDGRIWIPPSTTTPREFLLPVFMEITTGTFEPIKNFEFSVSYNSKAFRAIGVQSHHPITFEEANDPARNDNRFKPWTEPLAKGFNFSVFDEVDTTYTKYIFPTRKGTDTDPASGRRFRIVGTSTSPLPARAPENRKYDVLLYVVFRVVPVNGVSANLPLNTPIIINNDIVKYNGVNIRQNTFVVNTIPCVPQNVVFTNDEGTETNQSTVTGITGLRNDNLPKAVIDWQTYPERYLPGVIWATVFERIPEFSFLPGPSMSSSTSVTKRDTVIKTDPGYWYIANPLTVDISDIQPFTASRIIQVRIPTDLSQTRLQDIKIETDQPWLQFRTVAVGTQSKSPIPVLTRKNGFINYIDYGILGAQDILDPRGVAKEKDKELYLMIDCDPSKLTISPNDPEKEGLYTGHLIFSSPYAGENPVKVKVTFVLFKTPVEPEVKINTISGIKLNVSNSIGGSKNLIFGTGKRATDDIDFLYGEGPYEIPLGKDAQDNDVFDARWFPVDPTLAQKYEHGFWDFAANEIDRRSDSRDIRDFDYTAKSHVFLCKFNAKGGYPIVLTWDTTDFYPGSQMFIHDTRNGELFPAVNMREATSLGNGKFSYTIMDARATQFMIEYTLPTVIDYVNKLGEPIIKEGWNLLSMPVRPINAYYQNFYKNAINIPMQFTQNQYQEPPDGVLKPGYGYFVKYDKTVDTKFPGTFIYDLDKNQPPFDAIRLYTGWNTIGAVSVPVGINEINFEPFTGTNPPDINYTRQYGVWAYITNEGYKEVSEILPGLGYWLKVKEPYYLKVNVPAALRVGFKLNAIEENALKNSVIANASMLNLKDSENKSGKLYVSSDVNANVDAFELPPTPFTEMFDVRFAGNRYLTNENESVVRVQGVKYPLTVSLNNPTANYTVIDAVTGEVFGTISKNNNSVTIKGTSFDAFKLVKSEVLAGETVLAVSPNPVANVSTVNFAAMNNENVNIVLFDALGNEVATLVNETLSAGAYTVSLNASNLANGNYILKLVAGNRVEVVKVNVVK